MKIPNFTEWVLGFGAALTLAITSGCSSLLPKGTPPPSVYALDAARNAPPVVQPAAASALAPTLIVNPTLAAPGFDSQHIVYVRAAHQLEHFARSEWVDTPARMLGPLIVSALETTGAFRAIAPATSGVKGDLRLDTEVLRLQQEFGDGPSHVRFTLRATLSDNMGRQVISWREFDATVRSAREDPYGGVVAANVAVQLVMEQLATFCTLASEPWWALNRMDLKPARQQRPLR